MTEQIIIDPPLAARAEPEPPEPRPPESLLARALRYPWLLGALGLLLAAAVLVLWARARPGYDPYGWLVWGKLTVHFNLDTNGAPSWKPLPFLFTVPFSVVGHYALWLWMIFSLAVSLSGFVFAWRIAFFLTDAEPQRRYASYAAGLAAAAFLLLMQDPIAPANYAHYLLSAESDTMIVALCLAAIDCHLRGRHTWAFWVWWFASLGRPEVWPFLGLAGLWLWRTIPTYRRWLYASLAGLAALWFGIPGLSSKSFLTASNIAHNSPRACHVHKITCTIDRFHQLLPTTVWITAAVTVALAAWRRRQAILVLTAGTVLWVIIEIGFAVKGFPAVPRYMFEAGAVVGVLAGVFVGRLILELPPLVARALSRLDVARVRPQLAVRLGAWGAAVVLVVVAGSLFGAAHRQYRLERVDLTHERSRTTEIGRLSTVVARLGSARIQACGQANIPIEYQSILAWYMNVKTGALYVSPTYEKLHPHPLVNIYPIVGGWKVFPSHLSTPAQHAACDRLTLVYRR